MSDRKYPMSDHQNALEEVRRAAERLIEAEEVPESSRPALPRSKASLSRLVLAMLDEYDQTGFADITIGAIEQAAREIRGEKP